MRYRIGVVVGRFQVAELTEGHKRLIDYSIRRNNQTIILIGTKQYDATDERNPLPYLLRKRMIENFLFNESEVSMADNIYPIEDKNCFPLWCKELDMTISAISNLIAQHEYYSYEAGGVEITLYGGRDSYINEYNLNYKNPYFDTEIVDFNINEVSGTKQREEIKNINSDDKKILSEDFYLGIEYKKGNEIINTVDFRKGIIYKVLNNIK